MTPTQHPRHPVVLVALDGSPAAVTALPIARTIAAQLGAETAILHVTAAPMSEEDVRQRLHLQQAGAMDSELRIQVGDPATMILQATTEATVALVVLTTHGRTGEHGRRLGRVAEAVIAAATRPILLVRPEATTLPMQRTAGLRRLLLPLGGARATMAALHQVGELAARLDASVDLLYIANADQKRPAGDRQDRRTPLRRSAAARVATLGERGDRPRAHRRHRVAINGAASRVSGARRDRRRNQWLRRRARARCDRHDAARPTGSGSNPAARCRARYHALPRTTRHGNAAWTPPRSIAMMHRQSGQAGARALSKRE